MLTELWLKRGSPADEPLVQKIFAHSPEYFRKVEGSPVLAHFARQEMEGRPKKQSSTYQKVFCLLFEGEQAIGVADLHQDHPEAGICYLGLLLLEDAYQGRGFGRKAYARVEDFARTELHAKRIRLGVSEKNDVEIFWQKLGFARNGHTYEYIGQAELNFTHEMEKIISGQ